MIHTVALYLGGAFLLLCVVVEVVHRLRLRRRVRYYRPSSRPEGHGADREAPS